MADTLNSTSTDNATTHGFTKLFTLKGSVAKYGDLPKDVRDGDLYNIREDGYSVVRSDNAWKPLRGAASTENAGIVKLSDTLTSDSTTEAATARVTMELRVSLDDLNDSINDTIESLDATNNNLEMLDDHTSQEISKIKSRLGNIEDRLYILETYEIVKFNNLNVYLRSLATNDTTSPYRIKVTEIPGSGVGASTTSGTLGNILKNNNTKYVSLKFDDSLNSATNAGYMFYGCTSLTEIDTSPFTKVTNAYGMFSGCTGLTKIDASPFANVKTAGDMFYDCVQLVSVDRPNFISVTTAKSMFYNCNRLDNISAASFTRVTNADYMFYGCRSLRIFAPAVFTSLISATSMFSYCNNLVYIDTPNFRSVTTATSMFLACYSLGSIDTSPFVNVTDANGMFSGCTLTAYYSSEEDNLYKNYKNNVSGSVKWVKK